MLGRKRVEGLVRRGRWEVVQRGVYRAAGSAQPPEQAHLAAVFRVGEPAVLTGEPALGLLGIEGNRVAATPVVIANRTQRVRSVSFEVRYLGPLHRHDCAKMGPLPIATPHRMLVDRARDVRGKELRVMIDALRRRGSTDVDRLREAAERALPQRGAARLLELIASGSLDVESEGERLLADLFADVQPPPEVQQWLLPGIRVDLVWRDVRLVVEYDGEAHHHLPTDREHDRRRRQRLREAGWVVMVVTAAMCRDPRELRARVLQRRAELAAAQRG